MDMDNEPSELEASSCTNPDLDSNLNQAPYMETKIMDNHNECLDVGLEEMAVAQRIGLDSGARAERIGFAELNAVGRVASDVCDSTRDVIREVHATDNHLNGTVERHSLYNAGVTQSTADKTQAEVERFGLSELEAIRCTEKYLYAGMSENAKDILLQAASNTASIKQAMCEDTKDLMLQACNNTDSIKSQSASQFKDLLLQSADIAKDAAVAAALNAKDAELSRTVFGKDAALAAAVNYEKLFAQGDRNTSAIQASIAECCCEQKELVRELDKERIRDELAKTREELIALRVRSTLLPALVGSAPI